MQVPYYCPEARTAGSHQGVRLCSTFLLLGSWWSVLQVVYSLRIMPCWDQIESQNEVCSLITHVDSFDGRLLCSNDLIKRLR